MKIFQRKNWKFWTLLVGTWIILMVLVISYFELNISDWLQFIVVPLAVGIAGSTVVSIWFLYFSERDKSRDGTKREIDGVLTSLLTRTTALVQVASNIGFSIPVKKGSMMSIIEIYPDMYHIRHAYPDFWKSWELKRNNSVNIIRNIDNQNKLEIALIELLGNEQELTNSALKMQEQYLQDIGVIPKAPIPDMLVFHQDKNSTQK